MICRSCGRNNPPEAKFCLNCGAPVAPVGPVNTQPAPQPPVQPQSVVRPQSAQQPPKPKKRVGLIILLVSLGSVLLVSIIAGVAFLLLWMNRGKAPVVPTESPVYTSTENVTEAPIATGVQEVTTEVVPATADVSPETTQAGPIDTAPQTVDIHDSMTDSEIYELNVFLSNFSEAGLSYFEAGNRSDSGDTDLIAFAYTHTIINNYSALVYDGDWMKISAETIEGYTSRFMNVVPLRMDHGEYRYINGFYCLPAASGESYNFFTIADKVNQNPDGTFTVYFRIYQVDYEVYFDEGIPDAVYRLRRPEDSTYKLTLVENGCATVKPYKLNSGKDSYQLTFYEIY